MPTTDAYLTDAYATFWQSADVAPDTPTSPVPVADDTPRTVDAYSEFLDCVDD